MSHGGDIYRNRVNMDFSVNMNPLGIPAGIRDAISDALPRIGDYPDPLQERVREALAHLEGVGCECVTAGSGVSGILMAVVRALAPKRALLFEPCFSGYEHALRSVNCSIRRVMLREEEDFSLTAEQADQADQAGTEDVVVICDPMSPSGRSIDDTVIERLLEKAAGTGAAVILDESFYLLSDKAALKDETRIGRLIRRYEKLYILRSFTKFFALPGIRAGYVLSAPGNISNVIKQLPEWNLSTLAEEAVAAGCSILEHTDYADQSLQRIRTEREYLVQELSRLNMTVYKSNTSFLLFRSPAALYDALLGRGILIRDCRDYPGLGQGMYYRIAVKNHSENELLIQAIREVVRES